MFLHQNKLFSFVPEDVSLISTDSWPVVYVCELSDAEGAEQRWVRRAGGGSAGGARCLRGAGGRGGGGEAQ